MKERGEEAPYFQKGLFQCCAPVLWITDNTCRIFVKDTKWLFPSRLVSFDCHFLLQRDYSRPLVVSDWTTEKWRREKCIGKFSFYFWASVVLSEKRGLTSKMELSLATGKLGSIFINTILSTQSMYVYIYVVSLSLRGWVNNFSFLWEMGELFVWGGPPLFTQWAKQTDSRASSYRLASSSSPRKSWTQKVSCTASSFRFDLNLTTVFRALFLVFPNDEMGGNIFLSWLMIIWLGFLERITQNTVERRCIHNKQGARVLLAHYKHIQFYRQQQLVVECT